MGLVYSMTKAAACIRASGNLWDGFGSCFNGDGSLAGQGRFTIAKILKQSNYNTIVVRASTGTSNDSF